MAFARWAFAAAFVVAACGSDDGAAADATAAPDGSQAPGTSATTGRLTISNEGGSMEGHTPLGFAGSGTGLFAGDSLNPSFPADDGVQIWLTFAVPAGIAAPSRAVLSSDELTIDGSPFEDLGVMQAEPVTYDSFGPSSSTSPPTGRPSTANRSVRAGSSATSPMRQRLPWDGVRSRSSSG